MVYFNSLHMVTGAIGRVGTASDLVVVVPRI
jgi:hypothetical protein